METAMTARPLALLAGAVALALCAGAHAQQIFKCIDRQGKVTYADAPCPKNSARATDITSVVHACADEECEARRAREREQAQARLSEDKLALSELQAQRRKADAEYLEQMTRLQESRARQAAAERPPYDPNYYGYGWGYGWGYPGRPVVRPPLRPPVGTPRPQQRPDPSYTSPPVAKNVR
jgi:hypothetical protein